MVDMNIKQAENMIKTLNMMGHTVPDGELSMADLERELRIA